MPEKETFGQRLKQLRKKQGMTQAELAFQIGVHEMTVRRWEQGITTLENIKIAKALAAALHVSEDELLNGVPEQNAWVLHVQIGDNKEEFIDMGKLAKTPVCAIITDANAGFIKLGGNYELWQDDALFKRLISDLKKLRSSVIQNGRALGGIKDEEGEK